jgi:hypothetical protein
MRPDSFSFDAGRGKKVNHQIRPSILDIILAINKEQWRYLIDPGCIIYSNRLRN